MSALGFSLGSQVGQLVGGNNPFAQVAASTVLGALGNAIQQNLSTPLDQMLKADGDSIAQSYGDGSLGASFETTGVSLVSSQLTNELLHAIGITGFGGQLASVALTPGVDAAVTYEINQLFPSLNLQPGGSFSAANIASFLGSELGQLVISPETQTAAVLADLGSTAGSAIGVSFGAGISGQLTFSAYGAFAAGDTDLAFTESVGASIAGPVGAAVGAFVGFVLGALFGDLFGHKKPRIPTASSSVVLQIPAADYEIGSSTSANGGDLSFVTQMANTAANTLNGIIYQVVGASGLVANSSSPTQTYGLNGNQIYVSYGGTQYNENTGDMAVNAGVIWAIKQTELIGGNIFAKRAIADSTSTDVTSLLADLQIASDYTKYRTSWQSYNQLLAANPDSALTAGWIVTLQRANELNLDAWNASDFYGGLQGFLSSFGLGDMASGPHYENITIGWDGTNLYATLPDAIGQGVFSVMPSSNSDGSSVEVNNFLSNFGYDGYGANANFWDDAGSTSSWNANVSGSTTNDILIGGNGGNTITAGSGYTWIQGGSGSDTLTGGSGYDVIIAGSGSTTINSGSGGGYFAAGSNIDTVNTSSGAATVVGGTGTSAQTIVYAGSGSTTFIVSPYSAWDQVAGWSGGTATISFERYTHGVTADLTNHPSWLTSGWNNANASYLYQSDSSSPLGYDFSIGVEDNYVNLIGSQYNDVLKSSGQGGVLEGLGGADQLIGGGGITTASYQHSAAGVYVDLSTNTASGGDADGDTFSNIQNLLGSSYDDELKGLYGSVLNGGGGDDTLDYSGGDNQYIGGDGFDTVDYSAAPNFNGSGDGIDVNLANNTGAWDASGDTYSSIEKIVGTAYTDYIYGTSTGTTFDGGGGNDYLYGGSGSDTYIFNLNYGVENIYDNNSATNVLEFGPGISFDDLWIGTQGGSSGYVQFGIRGESGYAQINGDTGAYPSSGNDVVKTLDMDGAGQVDIGQITYGVGGSDNADTLYGLSNRYNLIFAYGGDDTIYASDNQVSNYGNVIDAGLGDDWISSSNGDDQYLFERGDGQDTILDTGGQNTVVFGPTVAADDVIYQIVGDDLYIGVRDLNNPNLTASQVSDNMRFVGGGVLYENVNTGQTTQNTVDYVIAGGTTVNIQSLNLPWTVEDTGGGGGGGGGGGNPQPPIVLDLYGDGLQLTPVANSDIVAVDKNGIVTRMGWVGPDDGILAVDRSGTGELNNTADISFIQDKPGATTDLQGLAAWDTNGDGIISDLDAGWSKLLVWVDKNQDGISEPGEVYTLDQLGITSINLNGTPTGFNGSDTIDSYITNTTTFTRSDGTTGTAYDVALAERFLTASGIENAPDVTWDQVTGDQTIGHLLNDPMAQVQSALDLSTSSSTGAATAAMNALATVGQALGNSPITEKALSALADVDFSPGQTISASDATLWSDFLDPTKNTALKAAEAAGMSGADLLNLIQTTTAYPLGTDELTGRGVAQVATRAAEPIIVDFGGSGLNLTDVSNSTVKLDVQHTGVPEQIGWVGPSDGILAYDLNGDGKVDPTSEISFAVEKPGAKTSIQGLAAFDTNGDGVIDASDSSYSKFLIWRDANGNGVSDPGETETLQQAGIKSISLKASDTVPNNGDVTSNQVLGQITVTMADGTTRVAYDTALGVDDPSAAQAPTSTSASSSLLQSVPSEASVAPTQSPQTSTSASSPSSSTAAVLTSLGTSASVTASRLGEDGPEGAPSQAVATNASVSDASGWWAQGSSLTGSILDSLTPMTLAGSAASVTTGQSLGMVAGSPDAATAQRQLLLQQSLVAFQASAAGTAAIWAHEPNPQGAASLAATAQPSVPRPQAIPLAA